MLPARVATLLGGCSCSESGTFCVRPTAHAHVRGRSCSTPVTAWSISARGPAHTSVPANALPRQGRARPDPLRSYPTLAEASPCSSHQLLSWLAGALLLANIGRPS